MPSARRDVTRTCSPGKAPSSCATRCAAGPASCSKLSSTSKALRPASASVSAATGSSAPAASCRAPVNASQACALVVHASKGMKAIRSNGSDDRAPGSSCASCAVRGAGVGAPMLARSACAVSTANRVLPLPPGPYQDGHSVSNAAAKNAQCSGCSRSATTVMRSMFMPPRGKGGDFAIPDRAPCRDRLRPRADARSTAARGRRGSRTAPPGSTGRASARRRCSPAAVE